MLYMMYEMNHAAIAPLRMAAKYGHHFWTNSTNPVASSELGRSYAASLEMFERLTRRYGKPEFAITATEVEGNKCTVQENSVWEKTVLPPAALQSAV